MPWSFVKNNPFPIPYIGMTLNHFFVLIWIMFHWSKISPNLCFGSWCTGDWVGIHGSKQGFLLRVGNQLPRDLPLLDDWIKPLWMGFVKGYLTKRSEEHTSELQSHLNLVCRLLLEKKKKQRMIEVLTA